MENENDLFPKQKNIYSRKDFITTGVKVVAVAGITSIGLLPACSDGDKKVSPPEDLMQEHGLLNRVLLIYDTCKGHLINKEAFDIKYLAASADIIRTFVEEYHEKQEENYLFTRFEKAGQLTDLVKTLREQHKAGRVITDRIMILTKKQTPGDGEADKLIQLLANFNHMYRPHEAREDTVLFPAFRNLVTKHEYDALGEEFEDNEHKLFGNDGFETMVNKVADIEKALGIHELAQFTPSVPGNNK